MTRKFKDASRKFEKVSFEQFKKDFLDCFSENDLVKMGIIPDYRNLSLDEEVRVIWENIKLPKRATKGSAGYDFFAPIDLEFPVGKEVKFPTGIRVKMPTYNVLKLYPRSGLGFKFRLQLNNTVGIIDSDYYYSSNEGHMFAKMICDSRSLGVAKTSVKQGEAYMQGIFEEFLLTDDDDADGVRNGGFGSTTDANTKEDPRCKSMNVYVKPTVIKKDRYEVGDRVLIKSWDEMASAYGIDDDGDINCDGMFVKGMKRYCDCMLEIKEINGRFYTVEDDFYFDFTNDMIVGCVVD